MPNKQPDTHITAAGGVLFRLPLTSVQLPITDVGDVEVLLIYRNGFWDLPKGKRDVGESIPACAAREVAEEVDCHMPMLLNMISRTEHQYEQDGVRIAKTTWWYAMVIKPGELKPQKEEGIERVEWVKLPKAKKKVGFDNLVEALSAFEKWFQQKTSRSMNG
ncbi:MAG: NUDIX domain-containing protein [Bacteroidetes bacterium]|nr:NUDIX domain-containing protein [Bacteroidota bacterium]MCH8523406.1 NUDIX domain-containing protein [Balneolales bacterium]